MDSRTLKLFLSLADTLHFGRTAEQNHMSPSTLTRLVKQLETQVGATLFQRDNRSVALTPEGELFRSYAIESNGLWTAFKDNLLEATQQLTGTLSLYCSVTASHSFMFELLAKLRENHPGIRIMLQTGDPERAVERVQTGDAQISIGSRPAGLPAAIQFKTIATTPLVFIAPKNRQKPARSATKWHQQPMILPQSGVARDRITRWFKQQLVAPDIAAQVAGNEAIVSMVSLGGGIGLVPRIVLDNSPIRDRIRILPVASDLEPLEVGMFALRKNTTSRLVNALWNLQP